MTEKANKRTQAKVGKADKVGKQCSGRDELNGECRHCGKYGHMVQERDKSKNLG